jgi:predicted SnoaL-like aldol condensation-catalyzing enzyme
MAPPATHGDLPLNNALALLLAVLLCLPSLVLAQEPVQGAADHRPLLESPDPLLAANKRVVYDFWREVFEGGHLELADKYLAESYVQHNPNVPTGRAGFVEFFAKFSKPKPTEAAVKAPLVSIVAERDLVTLVFVKEQADPNDPTRKYTTTWFDMFRVADGRIVEHWDPALKQ